MEAVDVIIIGGGAVGLAVAERLGADGAKREIVLMEKEDGFGRHTSSRNSEVIHAGFYYPTDSLKARLCVEGNRLMYEFCGRENVPVNRCGKIVVGNNASEIERIHHLYDQGVRNGVSGLELLTSVQVGAHEPAVRAVEGLLSPSTGIFDTHRFMKRLEQRALAAGVTIAYHCEAIAVRWVGNAYEVDSRDTDGTTMILRAPVVINAAGLWSDSIAAMAGIDIDKAGYRLHPCKGEYFSVAPRHKNMLQRLVYPAPTKISLGVHAVLSLSGSLRLGPNAYYVNAIDYATDDRHHREFYENVREYLPFIDYDDLTPDISGIRPKLQTSQESFHDFVIREESDRGRPGLVNLIGIESPGLTASLAIATHVVKLLG